MKNILKIKIGAVFGIFILSFIVHFIYSVFPCRFTSFFFPVNESIFEHMKIIYTSTLLYGIIDYFLLKNSHIKFHNFLLQLFLTSFLGIILYLILYLPIRYIFCEYFIISIILIFVVYCLMQILSYYLLIKPKYYIHPQVIIFLIILIYIIFIFFTYHPIHNMLFYDTNTKSYGIPINKYSITYPSTNLIAASAVCKACSYCPL